MFVEGYGERQFRLPKPFFSVIVAAVVVVVALPAMGEDIAETAKQAITAGQYCTARDLFVALHRRDKDPKYLYNAAESAAAADDRVSALTLYQQLLEGYPTFERADKAKQRITELGSLIASSGQGTQCPARAARCGDTYLDATEMCDDGNNNDADGCDHNCTPTSCGNGIVTPPETCDDGNTTDGDACPGTCGVPGAVSPSSNNGNNNGNASEAGGGAGLAPILVTAGGGVVLVGGAIVAAIGGVGYTDLDTKRTAFDAAAKSAGDDPDNADKLGAVVDARAAAQKSLDAWNGLGQTLFIAGVAAGVVGAGGVAAGITWLVLGE